MSADKGYGRRIRTYRMARNLSQEELTEQAGLPETALSRIEHGARKVTLDEAVRLAEVLRISLGELAGMEESLPTQHGEVGVVASRCLGYAHSLIQELGTLVTH